MDDIAFCNASISSSVGRLGDFGAGESESNPNPAAEYLDGAAGDGIYAGAINPPEDLSRNDWR